MILYEYPFNERIRTYLRLEHLFQRLVTLVDREDRLDHHFALLTLFEIMEVASRSDMKSDVLKDLEKQKQLLNNYRGNPAISETVLDQVVARIEGYFLNLNQLVGKTGQSLTEKDWLMSVRSRIGIPGGTCSFDLPAYHDWQHKPAPARHTDLALWCDAMRPLCSAIGFLLQMLRDSGTPQRVVVTGGQFQQTLPQGRTFQLLRLRLDKELGLVPEISGNRLLISVRMMRMGEGERLCAVTEDTSFELAMCS